MKPAETGEFVAAELEEAIRASFTVPPCSTAARAVSKAAERGVLEPNPVELGIALRHALSSLGRSGLMGSAVDASISGLNLSLPDRLLCLELLARTSNELAFLCQQPLGATALMNGEQSTFRTQRLLASYCDGRRMLGIPPSPLPPPP